MNVYRLGKKGCVRMRTDTEETKVPNEQTDPRSYSNMITQAETQRGVTSVRIDISRLMITLETLRAIPFE
jgi:hypothetical protein